MRTALFTGAGASRAIGYPLTSELLPRVLAELKSKVLFNAINRFDEAVDLESRRDLEDFLRTLLPGIDGISEPELPLITDIFSLVEYALLMGENLPVGGNTELRRFRDLLKYAITDVILRDFIVSESNRRSQKTEEEKTLDLLTGWVLEMGKNVGIVTTNYDIGLDRELYKSLRPGEVAKSLDIGFDWRDPGSGIQHVRPASPELRIYHLHGSLDQLSCPLCGYVYFNEFGAIVGGAMKQQVDDFNKCHCRTDTKLQLNIVSPSLVRDIRDANLLCVWRSALEWMRTADRWFIVGYSMPPEDLAVRSLLLRARASAEEIPEVHVIQNSDALLPRFKTLFPDCRYYAGGLEYYLRNGP